MGDRDVRKGSNGKIVELHHAPNEHSDGMLVVYLPAEKDPVDGGHHDRESDARATGNREGSGGHGRPSEARLHHVAAGAPPNPDRPLTNDDVAKAVGAGQ